MRIRHGRLWGCFFNNYNACKSEIKEGKKRKGLWSGAQSVGHASSEPSTAASLQWPALVTSEMLCFWNKLKLENNKFVQQEDSYMYIASCEAFINPH